MGVVALTEAERIGLLSLLGVGITASASIAAAWIANRVRRENRSQHGTSQELLSTLAGKVDEHGHKLDVIASRVDHAHARLDTHKPRRRWFR